MRRILDRPCRSGGRRCRTPRRRSSSRPMPWLVIAARTSGASATRSTSFWASSLSRTLSQTRLAVSVFEQPLGRLGGRLAVERPIDAPVDRTVDAEPPRDAAGALPPRARHRRKPLGRSSESTVPFGLGPAPDPLGSLGSERSIGVPSSSTAPPEERNRAAGLAGAQIRHAGELGRQPGEADALAALRAGDEAGVGVDVPLGGAGEALDRAGALVGRSTIRGCRPCCRSCRSGPRPSRPRRAAEQSRPVYLKSW